MGADPATSTVALVADLPTSDATTRAYLVEIVAEMVNTAETVAFMSGPQRELHAERR